MNSHSKEVQHSILIVIGCQLAFRKSFIAERWQQSSNLAPKHFTNGHKSLSFLLHSEHGFKQAPYEEITQEQYEALRTQMGRAPAVPVDQRVVAQCLNANHLAIGLEHACEFGQGFVQFNVMQRAIFHPQIESAVGKSHVFSIHGYEAAMVSDAELLGIQIGVGNTLW